MDNTHTVTHLPEPTALHHAATKRYVDTVVSDTVRTALSAAQSAADQTTATKSYVDDAEEALSERIEELQRQVAALAQAVERRP
jgi:polyhydroxyalkanoate synthesis regulator phasin